jgi:hypothetical protein
MTGSTTTITIVRTVDETLDRMHTAATNADLESYFDCFTSDGYFIGTDRTERWTIIPDFYNYTKPYFDQGLGWTYTPVSRHVQYLNNHNGPLESATAASAVTTIAAAIEPSVPAVALFDEILSHERFGITRNSGVMALQPQSSPSSNNYVWKIAQYHLTIPIPNRQVDEIVKIIQRSD